MERVRNAHYASAFCKAVVGAFCASTPPARSIGRVSGVLAALLRQRSGVNVDDDEAPLGNVRISADDVATSRRVPSCITFEDRAREGATPDGAPTNRSPHATRAAWQGVAPSLARPTTDVDEWTREDAQARGRRKFWPQSAKQTAG